jgi:N-acetylmuramoyl-L-alanine amidase
MYTSEGRRSMPVRVSGGVEFVALDRLAEWFGLTVTADPLIEGLTIAARDQRITLIPDQSFVSVGGRVESLSAPVQRDRSGYHVPIDFLTRALARALGQRFEIRRDSRIVVVGAVRVPRISVRFERAGAGGRLAIAIDPATPHRVSREGSRLTIQFDAAALDVERARIGDDDFIAGPRVTDATLAFELGPAVASFRTDSAPDDTGVTIDLLPPAPVEPPAPAAPAPLGPPPVVDLATPGVLRTVVIDPGHGGGDAGARGPGGSLEKDLTLQVAGRLKAAIENRLGLRVLLTREGDVDVPADRRSAIANNNKADLFISLHANGAPAATPAGAQVATLGLEAYRDRAGSAAGPGVALPVIGGGLRVIDTVPWDLAQLPFADRSTAVGGVLVRHLAAHDVPLGEPATLAMPLRVLVGAHMPAVLLEMGYLTNPDDERALAGPERSGAIVEALVDMIGEIRRRAPAGRPGRIVR